MLPTTGPRCQDRFATADASKGWSPDEVLVAWEAQSLGWGRTGWANRGKEKVYGGTKEFARWSSPGTPMGSGMHKRSGIAARNFLQLPVKNSLAGGRRSRRPARSPLPPGQGDPAGPFSWR